MEVVATINLTDGTETEVRCSSLREAEDLIHALMKGQSHDRVDGKVATSFMLIGTFPKW